MDFPTSPSSPPSPGRSFDGVADAYDRGRPAYPDAAAEWLAGTAPKSVLELGAGTGKLTEQLVALGHDVVATDPSAAMLRRLAARAPGARAVLAAAESIPLATRSVDVVVAAQAFHWFDLDRALPEITRVLRPSGVLALVWNLRDDRIPWVKRLGALIGTPEQMSDPSAVIDDYGLFETVDTTTYRFWQPMTKDSLRDLVASRSNIAVMTDAERRRILGKVDELYDGFGRGADGMLLPYVTHAYRTVVLPWAGAPEAEAPTDPDGLDTDSLLIDFR